MLFLITGGFNLPRSVHHENATNVSKILLELEREYVLWPDSDAQETGGGLVAALLQ